MPGVARLILPVLLIASCFVHAARGDETHRFALVVGNSTYTSLPALPNPRNDAGLVAESLRGAGFLVTSVIDADRRMLLEAVRTVSGHLRRTGGVGLFYYAGHAVQIHGENYLIPIGADIVSETDVEFEAVSFDYVLRQLESSDNALNVFMLDACRDNPFAVDRRTRGFEQTRGLSPVRVIPQGSVVMYATSPNQVAFDGDGQNSPFAQAVSEAIRTPGLDLNTFLDRVGSDVIRVTGGRQIPHVSKLFFGEFRFLGAGDVFDSATAVDSSGSGGADLSARLRLEHDELRRTIAIGSRYNTLSTGSMIVAGAGAAVAIIGLVRGLEAKAEYDSYLDGVVLPSAHVAELRNHITMFGTMAITGGGVFAAGLLGGISLRIAAPDIAEARRRIDQIKLELARLGATGE